MNYLLAVQAPAFEVRPGTFATESAFAMHLRALREQLGDRFDKLILIAPQLSRDEYLEQRSRLDEINAEDDKIAFVPAHDIRDSTVKFWLRSARPLWSRILAAVDSSEIVHSGLADDIKRPLMAMVNFAAWLRKRRIVFIVDIDFRKDVERNRSLRLWSTKRYLANRLVFDPFKILQVALAARHFDLVLLKGMSLVRDFGKGRKNVRFFLDAVHGPDDLIPADRMSERIGRISRPDRPLQLIYFGRLVHYKGLQHCVEAVRLARSEGADIQMSIVGAGEALDELKALVARAGLDGVIKFLPPVRYGAELFRLVDDADLALFTPLLEDTPRAALDAMARGLPLLASDLEYFQTLADNSGAVALARWNDPADLSTKLLELCHDREQVATMSSRALAFAAENTQAAWLQKRLAWTLASRDPN